MKSGEQADLVMRVSVSAGVPIGARMLNVLEFRTNDPVHPAGRIEALVRRVHGGVFTTPESVVIGAAAVGAQVRHSVDVWDSSVSPRRIERVTSSQPERVRVVMVPAMEEIRKAFPAHKALLVGRLEIAVDTARPGDVRALVEILVEGRSKPDSVSVVGRIAAPIEITPSVLLLPRASSTGPVYSALCVCRSTADKPLSLEVDDAPPGLIVKLLDRGGPMVKSA